MDKHKSDGEADEDYALTREHSDNQAVSKALAEDQKSFSIISTTPVSAPEPTSISPDSNGTEPIQVTQTDPPHTSLPPLVSAQNYYPTQDDPPKQDDTAKPHTYEDIANGEVDIQALLDNITANAEKNEAAAALLTPKSATSTSFPRGLPSHASLPPRPDIPRIGFRDTPSTHTYQPPPGVNIPLIAAVGAPGTFTASRSGLPPPPPASFAQNGSSNSTVTKSQNHAPSSGYSHQAHLPHDSKNSKWPPEINKQYDDFLQKEQEHVQAGLWGDFPKDSRMFIGKLVL
jgi:nuclear polyadenylated RNA-binding protein 3